MDDVPPGPTAPVPRRPALSVVIPVHNGGRDLERCLRRLRDSRGTDFELIVVDDGSTDGSAAVAGWFGARIHTNATPEGPASARNTGAKAASADLVFFLDADVAVHPDTLTKAVARFEADPGLSALFGSYDDEPEAPGLVSRYRNLLHHFVHQQGQFVDDVRPAHSFWTGCGIIRRAAFLEVGGFDPRLYARPAIEDIELGYRLTRAGHRIVLARDVLGTHLKRWTLASIVRTDIFQRGVPWMLLMKRLNIAETDLNVRNSQKVCVAVAALAAIALVLTPWQPWFLAVVLVCLMIVVWLNGAFYRFLAKKRGVGFAAGSVPLHLVYYGCCGVSVLLALALWHTRNWGPAAQGAVTGPMAIRRNRKAGEAAGKGPRSSRLRRPTRWTRP